MITLFSQNYLRLPRWIGLTAIALAVTSFWTAPARANAIDMELKQLGPRIMEYCQSQGWKNVGVLKFRTQLGQQDPTFHAGQLNSVMAIRLENVLILSVNADNPVGITRNASTAAVKQFQKADYATAEGRKQFLQGTYPLAWGNKNVPVDAFLTGTVTVAPDNKKTTVQIEVFDQKNPDLRPLPLGQGEVARFSVSTDRTTLADLNQTFYLANRPLVVEDQINEEELMGLLQKEKTSKPPQTKRLPFDDVLEFKVFYDDKPVSILRGEDGSYQVPSPDKGQKVHFTLKSRTPEGEQLGVVLLVNGINTFRKEQLRLPQHYSKWVLQGPDKIYTIRGFYPTFEKAEPFEILPEEESQSYPLADSTKRGKIELHVFRQAVHKGETQPDLLPSLRSENAVAGTLEEAKQNIISSTPAVQQGLILPGQQTGKANIQLVPFNNGVYVGHVTITYFQPEPGP